MVAQKDLLQDNVKGKFVARVPKNRIVIRADRWLAPGLAQSNESEGGGGTDKVKNGPAMKTRNWIIVKSAQTQKANGSYATSQPRIEERNEKPK